MKKRLLSLALCLGVCLSLMTTAVSAAGFRDVPAGKYYATPVSWAVSQGITNGKKDFRDVGGKLIATWAHFTDTTDYPALIGYDLCIKDCGLTRRLSDEDLQFVEDTVNGERISVCRGIPNGAEVLKRTDHGTPLVYRVSYGKGEILLVNTLYYPGKETILPIYSALVIEEAELVLAKEEIRVNCGTNVQYTVYRHENGVRHYYFTALDWYRDAEELRRAELSFGGNAYALAFPFGSLVKVVTNAKRAVWPKDPAAEVLEITDTHFKVQGVGMQTFLVAENGNVRECTVDLTASPVATVAL